MPSFKSIIQKSAKKDQQAGWTYIEIPHDVVLKLKLKSRREFRIKGLIDDVKVERLAVYPIKSGGFIIALNADLRKKLGKKEGAMVSLKFEIDNLGAKQSQELLDCLKEDKKAMIQFDSLTMAHQNYFHNHINSAKGDETKAKRIAQTLEAMHKKLDFGAMIRNHRKKQD